jgi:hypothetical protein
VLVLSWWMEGRDALDPSRSPQARWKLAPSAEVSSASARRSSLAHSVAPGTVGRACRGLPRPFVFSILDDSSTQFESLTKSIAAPYSRYARGRGCARRAGANSFATGRARSGGWGGGECDHQQKKGVSACLRASLPSPADGLLLPWERPTRILERGPELLSST